MENKETVPLGNPIDDIERAHGRQARLCDELEQIADTLPDQVDPALCDTVTQILLTELPLHRRDEEQALFPLLEKRALPEDNVESHLSQLCVEHATDEGVAAELLELLPSLTDGERLHEPNMFGYMLRSFFECYRRHLIWEQNLILPLARKRLGRVDLVTLAKLMVDHRRTRPF